MLRGTSLRKHIEDMHTVHLSTYECKICHKHYRTPNSLQNHSSRYHRRREDGTNNIDQEDFINDQAEGYNLSDGSLLDVVPSSIRNINTESLDLIDLEENDEDSLTDSFKDTFNDVLLD